MYGRTRPCAIGYALTDPEGGFAFQPPRTVFSTRARPLGARAIQNCPAVNGLERQLVELPSPVALRLRLRGAELEIVESGTFVQRARLQRMLSVRPPETWRHPKKPVIALRLPFFLVTDEPCMVAQLPPFLTPGMRRWPGAMVARRWPLHLWPQDILWSFEWDMPDGELSLKQGEPLCLMLFEFNSPEKRPELVEAETTPELAEYRAGIDGADQITTDFEALWEAAAARRPPRLLCRAGEAARCD